MRINHTPRECYKVYYYLPCTSNLFKDIKRWYFYKNYSSKQGALSGIKRAKEKTIHSFEKDFIWKIVWCPYPFANDDKCITVYTED